MIKANIAFSDLAEAPQWRDRCLHVGQSSITPYFHLALETVVVRTRGRWFAMIRERVAGRPVVAPGQLQTVDEERFDQAHQDALLWPLDYLMVEVAQDGCRIKLRAGVFGTAPVYCRATDTGISVSYDLADFLSQPCVLDAGVVSRRLGMHADYSARQVCAGVLLLTERAVLFARPGEMRYQYPPAIEPTTPSREPLPDYGVAAFSSWLSQAVQARPAEPGRAAVELSGGMDSATVACALVRTRRGHHQPRHPSRR